MTFRREESKAREVTKRLKDKRRKWNYKIMKITNHSLCKQNYNLLNKVLTH